MTNNSDVRLFNNEARGRNTNMQRDYMREKKEKEKKMKTTMVNPTPQSLYIIRENAYRLFRVQ